MATIREIKSLKNGNIDTMTDKEAIQWLKIWHKNFHCEVSKAKAAYDAAEKNCLNEGIMLGGSRRRRGRNRRSAPSPSPSVSPSPPSSPQAAAAGVPSPQAVAEVQRKSDIYDMLGMAILTAGAAGVGALSLAMGVDEGLTAILGLSDLSQCSNEARLAAKLEASFFSFDTVDYCVNAETRADQMMVAAPVALASLCGFFGITNAPAIMAGGVKDAQKGISSWLRNKFSGKAKTEKAPDALVNAAALAVDAGQAARAAARTSPPRQRAAVAQAAIQTVVSPRRAAAAPLGASGNTSPVALPSPPQPPSPTYSATTPPAMSPHTPTPEGEHEDTMVSPLGMDSPVNTAIMSAAAVQLPEPESDDSSTGTGSSGTTRSSRRRGRSRTPREGTRRSTRKRTPVSRGGKKKTRKAHHKKRKPRKHNRKHKTRKAHHKRKGRKGKKSRKH